MEGREKKGRQIKKVMRTFLKEMEAWLSCLQPRMFFNRRSEPAS